MRKQKRKLPIRGLTGFTMIELLVVVSIIAILLGIIVPTYYGVREQARRVKARSTAKYLETAFREFYNYHGEWPEDDDGVHKVSGDLYKIMQGQKSGYTNAYFEFEIMRDSSAPTNTACDPWKYALDGTENWQAYRVQFDQDFDNIIKRNDTDIYRSVIVWSPGPDRRDYSEDDIGSWE